MLIDKMSKTYDDEVSELEMSRKTGSLTGNTLHQAAISAEY
jgi:hypothetical protein